MRHRKSDVRHAACRTIPSVCVEKNGIYDKKVRERNISPSVLRPDTNSATKLRSVPVRYCRWSIVPRSVPGKVRVVVYNVVYCVLGKIITHLEQQHRRLSRWHENRTYRDPLQHAYEFWNIYITAVFIVVVLTLTRIIESVVTGQAPVTLELRNTPGKNANKPKVVHAYHS